jgi:hypothetical protein
MHETFQWSLYSNLLKRFSGLYIGANTYVSESMFGRTPLDLGLNLSRSSSNANSCQRVNESTCQQVNVLPNQNYIMK